MKHPLSSRLPVPRITIRFGPFTVIEAHPSPLYAVAACVAVVSCAAHVQSGTAGSTHGLQVKVRESTTSASVLFPKICIMLFLPPPLLALVQYHMIERK